MVLLHGMAGSGLFWGRSWDSLAAGNRLVVPDLLGFGASMIDADVDIDRHIAALDDALTAVAGHDQELIIVGHSMGAVLALHWAARHPDRVAVVLTIGAPLYRTDTEAAEGMRRMGWLETLMASDGPLPRRTCAWMCAHRRTAAIVSVLMNPRLPVPVARDAVQHTWHSYLGSMNSLIRSAQWEPALAALAAGGVPVIVAAGSQDPVPTPGTASQLAERHDNITAAAHSGGRHDLPLTDPLWCHRLLAGFAS